MLEPGCKSRSALLVRGEHLSIGPLALECAVEALDLAVLPRTVGTDEDLFGTQSRNRGAERVAVGPRVVGHEPFDPADAVGSEVLGTAQQERSAGRVLLIVQDLGV